MFPIYLKREETDVLPEEPFAFIVGRDGIYVQKRTPVMRAVVPSKEVASLAEVKCEAEYLLPPIPAELVMQMLLFFRAIWERERSEAIVLISYNAKRGTFRLDAPDQHVDAARCRYDPEFRPVEGFMLVGSCHSHGSLSAYHSGTDEHDEVHNADGIHITFGRIADKRVDIVATLVASGNRFPQEVERVLAGTKLVKNVPPRPKTPPPEVAPSEVTPPATPPVVAAHDEFVVADPPSTSASSTESEVILTDAGEVIEGEGAGLEAIIERNTEPEPQGPIAERVAQWQEHRKKRGGRNRCAQHEAQKQAQQDAQRERCIGFVTAQGPIEVSPAATGGTSYRDTTYEPEGFVVELPSDADPADVKPPLEWSAQVHKIEYVAPTYQSSGAAAGAAYSYHGGEAYFIDGEGTPYAAAATPSCKRCNGTHEEKKHRERDRDAVARLFEDGDIVGKQFLLDLWCDSAKSVCDALWADIDAYFRDNEITPPVIFIEKLRVFFKARRQELRDPETWVINRTALAKLAQKYVPEPPPEVAPTEVPPRTAPATNDKRPFSAAESLVHFSHQWVETRFAQMIMYLSDEEKDALWRGLEPMLGGDAVTKWKSMTVFDRGALVRDYLKLHRERFLQMRARGLPIDLGPPAREPETPMTEEERRRILAVVMEAARQSNDWQAFHDAICFVLLDLPHRDLWRLWRRALPRAKVHVIDVLTEGRYGYCPGKDMVWQLLRDFLLLCGTVEVAWDAITKPNDDLSVIRATEPLVSAFDHEDTPPHGVLATNQLDSPPVAVVGDKDAKEAP